MIINLQTFGEHQPCNGENLEKSGFSYNPEEFTSVGIKYKHFPYSSSSLKDLLSYIVQVVKYLDEYLTISQRNALIHCHNGKDRSTAIACCYLILINEYSTPEEAFEAINSKRAKSLPLEAFSNICIPFNTCIYFYLDLKDVRIFFREDKQCPEFFVNNQKVILGKNLLSKVTNCPVLLYLFSQNLVSKLQIGNEDKSILFDKLLSLGSSDLSFELKAKVVYI